MTDKFRLLICQLNPTVGDIDGNAAQARKAWEEGCEKGVDMVALTVLLMDEEDRRSRQGRSDAEIPMRPDHGHLLLDDINKTTNPGYSAIGRLKGLGELRGVARAVASCRGV
mgnify:CR=1 FL=1